MPVISARDISRAFGNRRILDRVSVAIHRGERVGVVGANGAGKSTLGKILAGIDPVDSGEVAARRGARIVHLAQRPQLPPETTALEIALSGLEAWCDARRRYESVSAEIAEGTLPTTDLEERIAEQATAAEELEQHGGWDLVHRAEAILGHLGIREPSVAAGRMSGGEQRRVALARVLIAQPDLAILDEPTNHLDLDTIDWLEEFLIGEYVGALLLITHDRYLLDRVATRTLEVNDGAVYSYDGGYEDYLQAKAERLAHEERAESNRRNLLRTELEWLRRQPKARTTKSQARIARIEATAAIARPKAEGKVELAATAVRSGKTILEIHDLRLTVDGHTLLSPLTLHLGEGERIGIVGANGCGKSTLLRCLVGEREPDGGRIVRGANTRIAYLEQGSSRLDDDATVAETVIGDRDSIQIGDFRVSPRAYLERFLFDYNAQTARVGTLSGGERARVRLAALLAEPSNLLILDEPTNDLDVPTLGALEDLLLSYGGTVLVVTHDRYFLDRVATSILAFEEGGRAVRHHGSFSQYLAARRTAATAPAPRSPAAAPVPAAAPTRERAAAKLSYGEERERAALPDAIDTVERRIAELERELADPSLYASRGGEIAGLVAELEERRAEVEELIARWEDLETRAAR